MAKYLVTYDLRGRDETSADYEELIEEIKSYDRVKIQKSVWLIDTIFEAAEVRDDLKARMDSNDRLLVTPIRRGSAWANPICGGEALLAFLRS